MIKMTKRERLEVILNNFSNEERQTLESLGRNRLYSLLDMEHDDDMLVIMLRSSIEAIGKELEKEKQEKQAAAREKARERREKRKIKDIEEIEDIEIFITKIGKVTIKNDVFKYFCNLFNFSIDIGIKKVTYLFIYYPKRMPLISINVNLNCIDAEYLLIDTIEDYIMLEDTSKNWSTFVGIFSKNVYSLLNTIGNKTVRRKRITIKENPCYVYNSNGELVKVIKEDNKKVKEEFAHEIPIMVSWEMLKEKELA